MFDRERCVANHVPALSCRLTRGSTGQPAAGCAGRGLPVSRNVRRLKATAFHDDMEDTSMTLVDDLEARVRGCALRARINYFFAYALLAVAVAASAASAIAVAASAWTKEINAILAALPGIIVLATSTFKFADRADWWWTKHHGLEALCRGLKFEGRNDAEVSREMTSLVKELEAKWPGFGKPPSGTGA